MCVFLHWFQSRVPECPLCGQPVRVSRGRGETVETQVERHIASGCRDHVVLELTPHSSSSSCASRTKTWCTHKGCKRKDLVPYTCPQCERIVCIRHRQPMDHPCHPPHSISVHWVRTTSSVSAIHSQYQEYYYTIHYGFCLWSSFS